MHILTSVRPEAAPAPTPAPTPQAPIVSLADVLTVDNVSRHLERLSRAEIAAVYGPLLPESVGANPTKEDVLGVVRSGFFQQATGRLSEQLLSGTGAGLLLSQSLRYDYRGEGIDGFLDGVREAEGRENEEER